jgi:hypothetical protein
MDVTTGCSLSGKGQSGWEPLYCWDLRGLFVSSGGFIVDDEFVIVFP